MTRRSTWLVVGALAVIALAAAFDALRGGGSAPPSAARTTTSEASAAEEQAPDQPAVAPAGFGGVLYYTDDSCELQAVRIPTLETEEAPSWDNCRFVLSPDGTRVSGAGSGWDPHADPRRGRLFQTERGMIQVATNGGPEGEAFRGAAPAWRPSGALTYFARGAVREWPSGAVLIGQRDLLAGLADAPDPPEVASFRSVRVVEAAWLDDDRLAAILSARVRSGPEQIAIALYDGAETNAVIFVAEALSDLRVSPRGDFIAARTSNGLLFIDDSGAPASLPLLGGYRAIAWSPDGRWAAIANASGVYVFRLGEVQPRARRLAVLANDLAWRGTALPPEIAAADEARDWLGDLPVSGRLFVTEPGCRLRALRMPDLVWEQEPDGVEAPCRFTLDAVDTPLSEAVSVAPDGGLRARCRDGHLAVSGAQGPVADVPEACAPAWMPDGTLTFVRDGELWRGVREPRRLISRQALRRMFGTSAALEEVAWLDDERVWAVVRTGPDRVVIAAMTPERLVYSPTFSATRIENLVVSASGMVAARTDRGVVFFDQGGRRALSFLGAQAVAWAPGTIIAAVASAREVLFVAPISREVVALSLTVEDLEWVVP
jgi:hypothetical protein